MAIRMNATLVSPCNPASSRTPPDPEMQETQPYEIYILGAQSHAPGSLRPGVYHFNTIPNW
jgi:hypothetical protein